MRFCVSSFAPLCTAVLMLQPAACSSDASGDRVAALPVFDSGTADSPAKLDAPKDAPAAPDADAAVDTTHWPDTAPPIDSDVADDGAPVDSAPDVAADVQYDVIPSYADCDKLKAFDTNLTAAADEAQKLSVVDAFVAEVEASEGFPIHCAGQVSFLFTAPQDFVGTPHVAGDFNSFDAAKDPMTLVAGSMWRATLTVAEGPNRYKYKFTDGSLWLADPLARRFGYDTYGEYSLVSGGTLQGHLERLPAVGGAGLQARPLTMYLPPGYESSGQNFPVLYAHDGQNLFDPSGFWGSWKLDATIESLLSQAAIQPFVVVGIHNTPDRMDEYTQVTDNISGTVMGGKADQYYQLITDAVMPLIASHYRIKLGPDSTWTMGSSLGGLVSLYFGMKHPETFGRVAGLSSTAGWGSIGAGLHNQTIIELLPTLSKPAVVFYLDSGGGAGSGCVDTDKDGIQDDTQDSADNYCETTQMRDVLVAQGYVYDVNLFHWWEPDAEHNEAAWAARVSHPLKVLAKP